MTIDKNVSSTTETMKIKKKPERATLQKARLESIKVFYKGNSSSLRIVSGFKHPCPRTSGNLKKNTHNYGKQGQSINAFEHLCKSIKIHKTYQQKRERL